jgi:aminoglycoside phosphotransferase
MAAGNREELALSAVDAYIARHPGLTRQGVPQPGQGATNYVVFVRRDETLLVCKVFCEQERKERERFALLHWRRTGLVPALIADVEPAMLVTSYVPGEYLVDATRVEGAEAWRAACRDTGRAVGALARVPLSDADRDAFTARYYGGLGRLDAYLGRIVDLGHSVCARDPDYRDPFWRRNLAFVEDHLDGVYAQPRVLYHQDVSNLHVQGGRFRGFFDLEMCRVGGRAMQLAAAVSMFRGQEKGWDLFCAGWEEATGIALDQRERHAIAAAHHLLRWREITRYLSYDGTPGSGYAWASAADPAVYRRAMQDLERLLGVER